MFSLNLLISLLRLSQADCNCEFIYKTCQPRADMGCVHVERCFVRTTERVANGLELLVHYGEDYFHDFGLPLIRQP